MIIGEVLRLLGRRETKKPELASFLENTGVVRSEVIFVAGTDNKGNPAFQSALSLSGVSPVKFRDSSDTPIHEVQYLTNRQEVEQTRRWLERFRKRYSSPSNETDLDFWSTNLRLIPLEEKAATI